MNALGDNVDKLTAYQLTLDDGPMSIAVLKH
jgi:hypothetical protein